MSFLGGDALADAKVDLLPIGAEDPTKFIQASDWNEHRSALLELRTAALAAATAQHFIYTASGSEGTTFAVALPANRASAGYVVQVTRGGPAGTFIDVQAIVSSFAVGTFNMESAIQLPAGYKLMISVFTLT